MNLTLRRIWLGRSRSPRTVTHSAVTLGFAIALTYVGPAPMLAAQPRANPPPAAPPAARPAPSTDSDQEARTRFQRGREAYQEGRYRDAWADFHEAYKLSGRPELLFNIGQTADRLGREADAIKAFDMYLQRLPAAANRRDVENRVRALRERIESSPAPPPEAMEAQTQAQTSPTPAPSSAEPVVSVPADPSPQAARRAKRERQRATPPPPTTEQAEPQTQAETPRERRRGLYLRAAGGLGIRADAIDNGQVESSIYGWGLALDLAAGWAVLPGFVVGGGVFLDWTTSPTLSSDVLDADVEIDHANLTTIGPFVDWYPLRRTLGLHIEAGLGLGILSIQYTGSAGVLGQNVRERLRASPTGVSFFLGTGYEWNIAGAFAIGVLVRLTAAALAENETSHGVFSPSLLMSLTWF